MITFPYGRTDLCKIPFPDIPKRLQGLMKRHQYPTEDGCYKAEFVDAPALTYSMREVEFYGYRIPIFIQCFLGMPSINRFGHSDPQPMLKAAAEFRNDIDRFPIEDFYSQLLSLSNVRFRHDPKWLLDGYAGKGSRTVVTGSDFEVHGFDAAWSSILLLHELYHFVELDNGVDPELLTKNGRWAVRKTSNQTWLQTDSPWVHNLFWSNGQYESYYTHLAETLAALTLMKHPEIVGKLDPVRNYLLESSQPQRRLPFEDFVWPL